MVEETRLPLGTLSPGACSPGRYLVNGKGLQSSRKRAVRFKSYRRGTKFMAVMSFD